MTDASAVVPALNPKMAAEEYALALADLEGSKVAILRESFDAMFARVEAWHAEARLLAVTAEDQKGKMARARVLRLEIRKARSEVEKRRIAMKASAIREGKAIDGAANVFKAQAEPLEEFLLIQETFAERAEGARRDALRDARQAALAALGVADAAMPGALGELSEEAWGTVLGDAKLAKQAREEATQREEAARVEASRIVAEAEAARRKEAAQREAERLAREEEQRNENARLRAEAEERERAQAEERRVAQVERDRVAAEQRAEREKHEAQLREAEAKARTEREAAEAVGRAEREAAAAELAKVQADAKRRADDQALAIAAAEAEATKLRQQEADRAAAEAEAKRPTKAKYATLIKALQTIASNSFEPVGQKRARDALETVGETAVG